MISVKTNVKPKNHSMNFDTNFELDRTGFKSGIKSASSRCIKSASEVICDCDRYDDACVFVRRGPRPSPARTHRLVCPSAGHAALARRQRGQMPSGLKRPGRDPTRWFLAPATPENVQSSSVTNTYPALRMMLMMAAMIGLEGKPSSPQALKPSSTYS